MTAEVCGCRRSPTTAGTVVEPAQLLRPAQGVINAPANAPHDVRKPANEAINPHDSSKDNHVMGWREALNELAGALSRTNQI